MTLCGITDPCRTPVLSLSPCSAAFTPQKLNLCSNASKPALVPSPRDSGTEVRPPHPASSAWEPAGQHIGQPDHHLSNPRSPRPPVNLSPHPLSISLPTLALTIKRRGGSSCPKCLWGLPSGRRTAEGQAFPPETSDGGGWNRCPFRPRKVPSTAHPFTLAPRLPRCPHRTVFTRMTKLDRT